VIEENKYLHAEIEKKD